MTILAVPERPLRIIKYFNKSLNVIRNDTLEQGFIFIFILWGGTCSLRMPTLRPASP